MEQLRGEKLAIATAARENGERELKKFKEELRPILIRQEGLWKKLETAKSTMLEMPTSVMQSVPDSSDGPNVAAIKDQISSGDQKHNRRAKHNN